MTLTPALTHGGLFEGYGGTTMAAQMALGPLNTRWVSDIKPASIALLEHHNPELPNLGDMTAIDWSAVEPVDLLTASWPCQPHSSAGKRLGEADPRALWPHVAPAIAALRPAVFLGENVARITSNGELRRVVRSLADLGYVGAWRVQRASDAPVYGCHQRARCFVVAVDPTAIDPAAHTGGSGLTEHPQRHSGPDAWEDSARGGDALRRGVRGEDRLTLLPTPCETDWKGPNPLARPVCDDDLPTRALRIAIGAVTLLPTPTQSMTTGAGTSGREGGLNLQTAAITLLPTPKATDGKHGGPNMTTSSGSPTLPGLAVKLPDWGPYAEAIARWGVNFDREAPSPTQTSSRTGKPQLSPAFVEWMQGLPEGHVTGVPDLSRNQQLSLLGDGVMPQQGAAAFTFLLDHLAQRLAVAA